MQRRLERIKGEGWGDVLFVPGVLLALVVYLSVANEFFLTSANLTNVLLQASILAIVAFGLTLVILSGELDLSVGAGVALVSVVTALVMRDTQSIFLGILAGVGTGTLIGLINGLIVTRLKVPSFIATLGMMIVAGGVALALTDGAAIAGLPAGVNDIVNSDFFGVRAVLWIVAAVFLAVFFIQSQTSFGVRIFAVGGNREAARLSAIPVERVIIGCFVITGVAVGIAGVVLTARVQSGQPTAGSLLALMAIAAIVVGGTNLLGGAGSVSRTLWGVLLITVLENGLQLQGVSTDLQQVVIGLVFIGAASAAFFRYQLRSRKRSQARAAEARADSESGSGPTQPPSASSPSTAGTST